MQHAQFVDLPPLDDIKELFKKTTNLPFQLNVSWTIWIPADIDDLLVFKPYIRPCHQKLLMDTLYGEQKNACSFLRQLLRPYGYTITKRKNFYTLAEIKEITGVVGKKAGKIISWSPN